MPFKYHLVPFLVRNPASDRTAYPLDNSPIQRASSGSVIAVAEAKAEPAAEAKEAKEEAPKSEDKKEEEKKAEEVDKK